MAFSDVRATEAARPAQMGSATAVFALGLVVTAISLPMGEPRATFTYTANGVGLALFLSLLIELQGGGLRSLLRTDIVMVLTLFGLTLIEFLIPQKEYFDIVVSPQGAVDGSTAVITGFMGLAIGRHFFPSQGSAPGSTVRSLDVSPKTMFRLFLLAGTSNNGDFVLRWAA